MMIGLIVIPLTTLVKIADSWKKTESRIKGFYGCAFLKGWVA
jgi:hypothetical protein